MGIEFEGESQNLNSTAPTTDQSDVRGMAGRMVKLGVAKTERDANRMLIVISIVLLIISAYITMKYFLNIDPFRVQPTRPAIQNRPLPVPGLPSSTPRQ